MIFITMHSQGILGLPRRIFDYSILYFKFNYFNSLSLIGITLSFILFITSLLTVLIISNSYIIEYSISLNYMLFNQLFH